jgi:NTP pyrophosphatase (non-canonical NTP hydrolase)
MKEEINKIAEEIHTNNKKWWIDLQTGEPLKRNVGEMLCLAHSEISEALEGHRKDLMDDHLPHRKQIEVELADAVIRLFDTAVGLGLDIGGAMEEKCEYNKRREDHKIENRLKEGGKKF